LDQHARARGDKAAPARSAGGRLPVSTKLFYGLGSIAYGAKDGAFKSFLLIYYNQVVGLPAGLVAGAILLALVADSLLDPLIGQVSDGLRSRWGRRHPFMYASALPAAASFLLLFMPPENWSQPALFGYIVVVSILVRSFIALYEIPSSALGPELSVDYDERTSIMAYRYMFAIVGGALLYIVTLKVFLQPEPGYPTGLLNPNGWWRYAVTAAIVMAVSILISAAGTHSRIPTFRKPVDRPRRSLPTIMGEMRETLGHGSFLALMGYGVIKFTGTGVVSALALYFATYWWKLTSGQIAFLALDALIGSLLALPLAPRLSKWLGKKRAAIVLLAVTVAAGPAALRFAHGRPVPRQRFARAGADPAGHPDPLLDLRRGVGDHDLGHAVGRHRGQRGQDRAARRRAVLRGQQHRAEVRVGPGGVRLGPAAVDSAFPEGRRSIDHRSGRSSPIWCWSTPRPWPCCTASAWPACWATGSRGLSMQRTC
jgi:Na+/melibiose symporter-like transporter